MSRLASTDTWCCCGIQSRTPSAPVGPSREQMPRLCVQNCLRACLAMLKAPGLHNIGIVRASVQAAGCLKKVCPFQTFDATGTCLAHHRQQLRHGLCKFLDQPTHMPCAATGSCLTHHRHMSRPWCEQISRLASGYAWRRAVIGLRHH